MKKTTNEIIAQIRVLLDELEGAPTKIEANKSAVIKVVAKKATGCVGVIQELINEGFFDEPKTIHQIMEKLKKLGQTSFTEPSVSMNLLNFVKPPKHVLERDGARTKWVYSRKK